MSWLYKEDNDICKYLSIHVYRSWEKERERVYVQIIININTDLLGGAKEERVHDNVIYY